MKDFTKTWKTLAIEKRNTREEHLIYCILKAMSIKSNKDKVVIAANIIRKAFTPTKNQNRLNNGWDRYKPIDIARYHIIFSNKHIGRRCSETNTLKDYNLKGLLSCIETIHELEEFKRILDNFTFFHNYLPSGQTIYRSCDILELPYTYIFVRQDLSKEQQLVQASHVTLKLGAEIGNIENLHFVVCGVENKIDLDKLLEYIINNNIEYVSFQEPDIGNQITAIASVPLKGRDREVFKDFKKLTYN